ncbi:MAG: RNA polymerase sigma factor [Chitinophagaceae bacterium]|nr:MAG: RNA polymerase sigma factor [Chitinophagaceae bacterium]
MQKEASISNFQPADQLAAIKQNDEAALKALYQQNFQRVEHYVLNNNGSTDEAKDVYQEAFIAVWRNIQLDRFTPVTETSLSGYLYQVAKNKWLDHLRSSHYKKVVPLKEMEDGKVEIVTLQETELAYLGSVRDNLAKLGDNCRELLMRFYYRKESLRVIAAAFDWTEATAKNNKYRCLQKLREFIKNK